MLFGEKIASVLLWFKCFWYPRREPFYLSSFVLMGNFCISSICYCFHAPNRTQWKPQAVSSTKFSRYPWARRITYRLRYHTFKVAKTTKRRCCEFRKLTSPFVPDFYFCTEVDNAKPLKPERGKGKVNGESISHFHVKKWMPMSIPTWMRFTYARNVFASNLFFTSRVIYAQFTCAIRALRTVKMRALGVPWWCCALPNSLPYF